MQTIVIHIVDGEWYDGSMDTFKFLSLGGSFPLLTLNEVIESDHGAIVKRERDRHSRSLHHLGFHPRSLTDLDAENLCDAIQVLKQWQATGVGSLPKDGFWSNPMLHWVSKAVGVSTVQRGPDISVANEPGGEVIQFTYAFDRCSDDSKWFEYDLALYNRGDKMLPTSKSSLSEDQVFAFSLYVYLMAYYNSIQLSNATSTRPVLRLINTSTCRSLDWRDIHDHYWKQKATYKEKLAAYILSTTKCLVDWNKEPFVPWKGMRFFHGTKYRLLQTDIDRTKNLFREQPFIIMLRNSRYEEYSMFEETWADYTRSMNIASDLTQRAALPDCALNPETSFTTPYVEKAINYSKDSSVFTYRLKKDGGELRMLDLRSDYHIPSKRTNKDRFSAISDLTGIKYGNDYTQNRTPLAKELCALFKDTDVDGAILNNDIEWVWFKPKENLAWEWSPTFGSFINRLTNIGFMGQPSEPIEIVSDVEQSASPSSAMFQMYPERRMSEAIERWSHPRQQLTETDKWSPEVFAPRIKDFLSGERIVNKQVTKFDYFQWTIPSNVPGTEYANQYVGDLEDVSAVWTREHIDASILRVVEVDYADFWAAVCPDALDMYMGNSVTEDYFEGEVEIATAYKILLQVLRSRQPANEKPVKLLFKLPNGRSQLVPPIDEQTKKLIADTLLAKQVKSKRRRDTEDDDVERPTSMQRTVGPSGNTGTKGRLKMVLL